jgi:hypothetical protein
MISHTTGAKHADCDCLRRPQFSLTKTLRQSLKLRKSPMNRSPARRRHHRNERVCGELLICVENQQFATHRPRTKQAPARVERGIVEDGLAALQPG